MKRRRLESVPTFCSPGLAPSFFAPRSRCLSKCESPRRADFSIFFRWCLPFSAQSPIKVFGVAVIPLVSTGSRAYCAMLFLAFPSQEPLGVRGVFRGRVPWRWPFFPTIPLSSFTRPHSVEWNRKLDSMPASFVVPSLLL